MFENRSFDNLLGRLYQPGEVQSFEGVIGKELSNPIPDWAEHGTDRDIVSYGVSPTMNTPGPIPARNCLTSTPNYSGSWTRATAGFSSRRRPSTHRTTRPDSPRWTDSSPTTSAPSWRSSAAQPTYDEYAQFMTGYTPGADACHVRDRARIRDLRPLVLRRPSCTFPNRSFFHAGTSSGYVVNMTRRSRSSPTTPAETLFDRLEAHGLTWKVYCDPPLALFADRADPRPRLRGRFATHFFSTGQFFDDAEKGRTPDLTPSSNRRSSATPITTCTPRTALLTPGLSWDPPSSLIGGEGSSRPHLQRDPSILVP